MCVVEKERRRMKRERRVWVSLVLGDIIYYCVIYKDRLILSF